MTSVSLRVCDLCGAVDAKPRHVIGHGPGEAPVVAPEIYVRVISDLTLSNDEKAAAVASLGDNTLEIRHIACCAAAGCPANSCTED